MKFESAFTKFKDEAKPVVDMIEDGAKKFAKNFRELVELAREESGKNLA